MAIARSIETFGFTAPILIDGMNRIVAGHGRLEAAKRLGLESVPVIRLEHLTDTQAKAYMLADNKLTDRSSWDDPKVAIVIDDLKSVDPWRPRGVEVRGRAEAIAQPTPLIRIHPERIVSWGLEAQRSARTVAG